MHLAAGIDEHPDHLDWTHTLLWALPLIRVLHDQGLLDPVPNEIPATLAALYRLDDLDAVYTAVFEAPPTRRSRRAFAAAVFCEGQVHPPRLTAAHAGRGLAPDQIADLLDTMVNTPSDPDNLVGIDLAVAAAQVLGARKNGRHDPRLQSDRLKLLAARPETPGRSLAAYLGTLGAAAMTGQFDPGGLQASSLDHLHMRAREALNGINTMHGSLSWLAGKPVPGHGPAMRYRIVTRAHAAELTYAGQQLHNCLGQWAHGGPFAHRLRDGDHIVVVVVDSDGRHVAAGHVQRDRLLNLLGPHNRPVPDPARTRIVRGLREANVTVALANDDEPPF